MTTAIDHIARALRYRATVALDGTNVGAAQAALRNAIMADPANPKSEAKATYQRLSAITMDAMPPDTDDVSLLLDVLAFRIGTTRRADAWASIGINPERGRSLLARNKGAVDWPIWFTLREAAIGTPAA